MQLQHTQLIKGHGSTNHFLALQYHKNVSLPTDDGQDMNNSAETITLYTLGDQIKMKHLQLDQVNHHVHT